MCACGWCGDVGSEDKNKTGDEERKSKEISAKIVMRHYNCTGSDEKRKLELRRIEKSYRYSRKKGSGERNGEDEEGMTEEQEDRCIK